MKNPTRLMSMIKKLSLGFFVLVAPQILMAESVPATVTTIKGDVTVTDASGKPVAVTQGSKLPAGDTIKTGATGTVGLTLVPGAGTVVQPNSSVKISTLDFNKGADGSNNRNVRLNLKNGSLISTLFKKDGHSDFQVATPYGVAAAKGTDWEVEINGTSVTLSVATGVVTLTGANGTTGEISVHAGQGYNTATGQFSGLSAATVQAIATALADYLPLLSTADRAALQSVIDALNNATINPATINSTNYINSPNGN